MNQYNQSNWKNTNDVGGGGSQTWAGFGLRHSKPIVEDSEGNGNSFRRFAGFSVSQAVSVYVSPSIF